MSTAWLHGHAVQDLLRGVAIAIRDTYDCHGVSTRQHNEPAGGPDVWHFHAHAFPRFTADNFYTSDPIPEFVSIQERQIYPARLQQYFMSNSH
jgi:histidine triad (HIT) family protein